MFTCSRLSKRLNIRHTHTRYSRMPNNLTCCYVILFLHNSPSWLAHREWYTSAHNSIERMSNGMEMEERERPNEQKKKCAISSFALKSSDGDRRVEDGRRTNEWTEEQNKKRQSSWRLIPKTNTSPASQLKCCWEQTTANQKNTFFNFLNFFFSRIEFFSLFFCAVGFVLAVEMIWFDVMWLLCHKTFLLRRWRSRHNSVLFLLSFLFWNIHRTRWLSYFCIYSMCSVHMWIDLEQLTNRKQ